MVARATNISSHDVSRLWYRRWIIPDRDLLCAFMILRCLHYSSTQPVKGQGKPWKWCLYRLALQFGKCARNILLMMLPHAIVHTCITLRSQVATCSPIQFGIIHSLQFWEHVMYMYGELLLVISTTSSAAEKGLVYEITLPNWKPCSNVYCKSIFYCEGDLSPVLQLRALWCTSVACIDSIKST